MLATQELHKQNSCLSQHFVLNARRLAEFLQSVEAKETLLLQRAREREVREALANVGSGREDSESSAPTNNVADENTRPTRFSWRIPDLREEYGDF